MKAINMQAYERKAEFNLFKEDSSAVFSITSKLDVTNFYEFISQHNKPYFISLLYPITRIANEIPQLRYRIDGNQIVECEHLNPSIPIGCSALYRYTAAYYDNYFRFVEYTIAGLELVKENAAKSDTSADGIIFADCLPIESFGAVKHITPDCFTPSVVCSEPVRIGSKYESCISVQGHSALLDYSNICEFIEKMKEFVGYPEQYINSIAVSEKEEINYDTRIIRSSSLNQRLRSEYPYSH